MLPLALAVLFETRFAEAATAPLALDLATAALASPRPPACRGDSRANGRRAGLWRRLRVADSARVCDLLARGHARLDENPSEALAAAQAARALAGPLLALSLLSGRAELRLGDSALAFADLSGVEGEDARAFVDARALHDYARAASLSGHDAVALRLYRLLASRVALLDDAREVAFVQIEAAAHVLAYAPAGADEALGYLSQTRRATLGLAPWIDALRRLAAAQSAVEGRAAKLLTPSSNGVAAPPSPPAETSLVDIAAPGGGLILPKGVREALAPKAGASSKPKGR